MRSLLAIPLFLAAGAASAQSPVLARDDRYVLAENAPLATLPVATNDRPTTLAGTGTVTILTAPQHGTAVPGATPGSVAFTVAADYSGADSFVYRICDAQPLCDEATVSLLVRPEGDVQRTIDATSGVLTQPMGDLRALASARFVATPLVAPQSRQFAPTVDTTPQTPWDGPAGVDWKLVTLPMRTDGRDLDRRIYVPATNLPAGQALLIGVDDDGDGLPDAGETRCTTSAASCELTITQRDDATVSWWMLVHNVDSPGQGVSISAYDVPLDAGNGSLTASGPGHLPRDRDFGLWLGWQDETQLSNERRGGFVRVYDGAVEIGMFPVVLAQSGAQPTRHPLLLRPGQDQLLAIAGNRNHRGLFIDVPPGATRLRVTTTSAQDVDLHMVRLPLQPTSDSTTVIPADPAWPVIASDTGSGGNEAVEIVDFQVVPGRWYAVVANNRSQNSTVTMHVEIDTTAPPVIERGSFFNPQRSGSGLFLYPAADQLTGLWYTYVGNTPTWYYLQAPAVQANRQWTSPVYRSAWDGDSNTVVAIGSVTFTADGGGNLNLSYRIDGQTGAQKMQPFGSGCPVIEGDEADLSSNWFDPMHAGTGYSVQVFPTYEFYAGFFYDDIGLARFVAAEFNGAGGDTEDLVLQQLLGACPTCAYVAPTRTDIGVLTRTIENGRFEAIEVDFDFESPLSGEWASIDEVQELGGPGTTQGCD